MFIDFLKAHYELIVSCLCLLISVFLTLIKKKPSYNKLDEIKSYILSVLPLLISNVECPGNGETKKALVIKEVQLLLAKNFGFTSYDYISVFVSNAIEDILRTPTKK